MKEYYWKCHVLPCPVTIIIFIISLLQKYIWRHVVIGHMDQEENFNVS